MPLALSRHLVLRKRDAAVFLDGFHALAAVRGIAGEDYADGTAPLNLCQRTEECIHRQVQSGRAWAEPQNAILKNHGRIGRNHIHFIGLDREPVLDVSNWHRGAFGQNLGQMAGVVRIEMLHDDEGHAGVAGQSLQQFGKSIEPAGRAADSNDGKQVSSRRAEIKLVSAADLNWTRLGSTSPDVAEFTCSSGSAMGRDPFALLCAKKVLDTAATFAAIGSRRCALPTEPSPVCRSHGPVQTLWPNFHQPKQPVLPCS